MNKLLHIIPAVTAIIFIFLAGGSVYAESGQKLYDNAGLLDEKQAETIEYTLSGISENYGHDIIIVTEQSLGGRSADRRNEELYSELDAGINGSGIILLIAIQSRDYDIYAVGTMADDIMIDSVRDSLAKDIQPYLSSGDYYLAFSKFAGECRREIEKVNRNGPNTEPSNAGIAALPCGLVIGLITVLVMKHGMKTTRTERQADNYLKRESMRITRSRDIFLYSRVTKTRKSSSSGGSRGGSHRSGHSGGKF